MHVNGELRNNSDSKLPDPMLNFQGRHFDLSNLCLDIMEHPKNRHSQHIANEKFDHAIRRKERSLYPGRKDMHSTLIDLEPVSSIMAGAPRRATWTVGDHGTFTTTPGSFYSDSAALQSKPPLPTCGRKEERTGNQNALFLVGYSSPPESVRSLDFDWSSERDIGPFKSDTDQNLREDRPTKARETIEISPGHFMELRGAAETLEAVDGGWAATTKCFCCAAFLKCVPDSELVLCPDCRVLSPVPEFDEQGEGWRGKLANSKFHSNVHRHEEQIRNQSWKAIGTPKIGGVGLGLKVHYR